jgi:hypothetical protein
VSIAELAVFVCERSQRVSSTPSAARFKRRCGAGIAPRHRERSMGELDGTQEHPRRAQDEPRHTDQVGHRETRGSGDAEQRASAEPRVPTKPRPPAEPRSRQEYASDMRAGEPIPASWTPRPDTPLAQERDATAPRERNHARRHDDRESPALGGTPDAIADSPADGLDSAANRERLTHRDRAGWPRDGVSGTDEGLRRRLADLESENAWLATSMKAIEARLERLEHAGQDQQVGGNEQSHQEQAGDEEARDRRVRLPPWASNEAVGLAAALGGGTLTTMADLTRALPATDAGVSASALTVAAAGLGWYRKHREDQDAARRRH